MENRLLIDSETDPELSERNELLADLFGISFAISLVVIITSGLSILCLSHQVWHKNHKHSNTAMSSIVHDSSTVSPSHESGIVSPGGVNEPGSTPTHDNTLCDPSNPPENLLDALKCLVISVAAGVATVVKIELVVGLINYIIWSCFIVPLALLVASWLLWKLGEWLEKTSRNCRRRRWWQRLLCRLKRILSYIVKILAILSLIAVVISLIVCIISIITLIVI